MHVPRPYLEHIDVGTHHFSIRGVYDFTGNGHAKGITCFAEVLQPFFTKALEGVGAGSGFKCSTAEDYCPSVVNGAGYIEDLLPRFNGTRAGNDGNSATTNFHPRNIYYRVFFLKLSGGELIWLADRDNRSNAFEHLNLADINRRLPYCTKDCLFLAHNLFNGVAFIMKERSD